MTRPGLSDLEVRVVDLIEAGWARWKIAEMLSLGDTTVRVIIKRLCERYECSMRDLPERTKEDRNG